MEASVRKKALLMGGAAAVAGLLWHVLKKTRGGRRRCTRFFIVSDPRGNSIRIRKDPDEQAETTGQLLVIGEVFAVDKVLGDEHEQRFLHLADGRGWAISRSVRDGRLLVQPVLSTSGNQAGKGLSRPVRANPGSPRLKPNKSTGALPLDDVNNSGRTSTHSTWGQMRTETATYLLEEVIRNSSTSSLEALQNLVTSDRDMAIRCRHLGILPIVSDVWKSHPQEQNFVTLVASILLAYAGMHGRAMRSLGIDTLCADALREFGPNVHLRSVAKLWSRIGKPTPAQVAPLSLMADADEEVLKPLLQTLVSHEKTGELSQDPRVLAKLEDFVVASKDLSAESMMILCKIVEPLEALPSGSKTADGAGSDSDGGSSGVEVADESMVVAEPPVEAAGSSRSSRSRPWGQGLAAEQQLGDDAAQRAANVAALMEMQATEAIPEDLDGQDEECGCWTPARPRAEFLAHLRHDAADSASWPVLFPGSGREGLHFKAEFDGSNLRRVRSEGEGSSTLELLLRGDAGRGSHQRWFFFDVEAAQQTNLRCHVITFTKEPSAFASGKQRIVALRPGECRWRWAGEDYATFPNRYSIGTGHKRHHTLAFSLRLESGCTRVAFWYPYLFGDVLADIRRLRPTAAFLNAHDLGPTPRGNRMLALTITDFDSLHTDTKRPYVMISARVHPGEVPASFMMRGVLELLLSDSAEARELRASLAFVVMPMLNPDGVALGHCRANGSGLDLNRFWEHPPPDSEAEAARCLLERLCKSPGGVVAFLDLHAHSGRPGAFTLSNPGTAELPDIIAGCAGPIFDRGLCTFSCTQAKRGSARCVAWRELGVMHAHTVEATYGAFPDGIHLVTPQHLAQFGQCLVRSCRVLLDRRPASSDQPQTFTDKSALKSRGGRATAAKAKAGPKSKASKKPSGVGCAQAAAEDTGACGPITHGRQRQSASTSKAATSSVATVAKEEASVVTGGAFTSALLKQRKGSRKPSQNSMGSQSRRQTD